MTYASTGLQDEDVAKNFQIAKHRELSTLQKDSVHDTVFRALLSYTVLTSCYCVEPNILANVISMYLHYM